MMVSPGWRLLGWVIPLISCQLQAGLDDMGDSLKEVAWLGGLRPSAWMDPQVVVVLPLFT